MIGRVAAMAEPTSAPTPSVRPGPIRRVGWVLAGTIVAGGLLALLYAVSPTLMPPTLSLLSAVGLGLVAGFLARWLLAAWRPGLRLAAATAALTIALLFVYWLTGGLAGLRLAGRTGPNWGGVTLLAMGYAASWLALRAWVPRSTTASPPQLGWPGGPRANGRPPRLLRLRAPKLRLPQPLTWRARLERARRRRRAAVTLLGEVEHRCPYCLEVVERRDRRGVVICPVCKTRHHADCWAVTGMCQVPHHQT